MFLAIVKCTFPLTFHFRHSTSRKLLEQKYISMQSFVHKNVYCSINGSNAIFEICLQLQVIG